jgi:hypothetical protein
MKVIYKKLITISNYKYIINLIKYNKGYYKSLMKKFLLLIMLELIYIKL